MKKKTKSLSISQRADELMRLLGSELPEVRLELANSFPSYNSLLNLHAKTFEEFALLPIAREQDLHVDDALFSYRDVRPFCPKCHMQEKVILKGKEGYFCNSCNIKFQANHNSLSSGFKVSSVVWRIILDCMLNFYTLKRTCECCGITATTYYNIRNRIFYAMQLLMSEVKLYGNIQCDNTIVHLSYKGSQIQNDEYSEDSLFTDTKPVHRKARKRGGSYTNSEKNNNSVCIFTAIDDYGHSVARMIGIGAASYRKLYNSIGSSKYLYTVPEKDPFSLTRGGNMCHANAGAHSLLIADGEGAIKKYASEIQMNFESNVYRKNGKQLKLGKDAHNIQKVNSLHSRLKNYLRKLNYVSSKYLPGFLVMFEFIENTGASEEAIGRLFEILAKPGLGRDKDFFDNLFVIPSIDEPTHKSSVVSVPTTKSAKTSNKNKSIQTQYCTVPADYLQYYDDYTEIRKLPLPQQITLNAFVERENDKYKKKYSIGMIQYYFKRIVQLGLRPPLPPKERRASYSDRPQHIQEKYILLYDEFIERLAFYRGNNEKVSIWKIYEEIGAKHGKSAYAIETMVRNGKKLKNQSR